MDLRVLMLFRIDPKIFSDFPGTIVGVVVAHNVNNTKYSKEMNELLKTKSDRVKEVLTVSSIAQHSHFEPWRQAYKKFGAKPDALSSIENLVQRILKKGEIRSINPLVDLYNIISLKYLLPAGGEDLDALHGNLELRFAQAHEKSICLLGEQDAQAPKMGEVMYADDNGAVCRRWNWKEADRTKITEHTRNAVFVLEALPPVARDVVEAAAHELAALIEVYCGGTATVEVLDQSHAEVLLKTERGYTSLKKYYHTVPSIDVLAHQNTISDASIETHLSDEVKMRMHKVSELQKSGIQPWPGSQAVHDTCAAVVHEFVHHEGKEYIIAGRLMSLRGHGKALFGHIQDRSGKVQLYIKADIVGAERYAFFNSMIDLGDFLWIKGTSFKTKMGEITVQVKAFELLSKCLHPLPEKFHGLTDIEVKYRQRYLDIMTSDETRERFKKRTFILRSLRSYLDNHDFLEVETPMLHPIPGGAAARPFVTFHNALQSNLFLRIAPELYLKRLVVGGFERVYEINRNFRNEGVSTRHNPEFTMLEFYMAHQDYHYVMNFVEEMLRNLARSVVGSLQLSYGDSVIDFEKPFARLSPRQALLRHSTLTEHDIAPENIDVTMQRLQIILEGASYNRKVFELFEKVASDYLMQPTFIVDFPIEVSPLAKRDDKDSSVAARFELYIGNMEISNGFNELNDPFDQAERFKEQARAHARGDLEAMHYDADYITALEYGLPPTVGVGIGIDRVVMLLTNTPSIKEVILFPALKRKNA